MKIKTRNIIIGIIAVIVVIFLVGYISGHRGKDRATEALKRGLVDTISFYQTEIGGINIYVAEKEQEIKTLRQAKHDGDVTNQELRKLNLKQVNEISRLHIRIDTLLTDISYTGRIDTVFVDNIPQNVIFLPFTFEKKDQWLNLNGTFSSLGKLDISLKMDISLDLWAGIDKDTKKPIAKVTSNNPYLGVLSINSIKLDAPRVKKFGIGMQGGYGLVLGDNVRTAPFIGVGLSYNLIRF